MSLEQLSTLTKLSVSHQSDGGAFSLTIDGFTIVPAPGLPGGKYVIFYTAAGQLILNGTAIAPAPQQRSMVELYNLAFPTGTVL